VQKAWLVWQAADRVQKALDALEAEASRGGADAVVGLRVAADSSETKSWYVAYGTAVKHTTAATPFVVRGD
jgi:uncharacterized protein YbjQ (UPF0145 family)